MGFSLETRAVTTPRETNRLKMITALCYVRLDGREVIKRLLFDVGSIESKDLDIFRSLEVQYRPFFF